jgi:hypothetical protein
MKFGAKKTNPVVGTEIKLKFWHWVSTLQATTPQPGPFFVPKQDRRTSFMIPYHPGFCTFMAPLLLIFFKGQNGVSDQLLGHFTPILLQWYLFIKRTPFK